LYRSTPVGLSLQIRVSPLQSVRGLARVRE
jgi:hypothetical protein